MTCDRCNAHKGTNLSAYDPQSDLTAPLFDPRRMEWHEHFEASGGEVRGLTPTGRATAGLLRMNEIKRRMLRLKLAEAGEWP